MSGTYARRALVACASTLMLAFMTGPAFAHHPEDHEGGSPRERASASKSSGASKTHGTAVTEDTDDDGFDNLPDPAGDTDNAHPSGKDRSAESGRSGNQGKAVSDPDDDGRGPDRSNRGVDQPGGAGGVDILDQDGNNGCGNDDDFEDDNEGKCMGPTAPTTPDCPQGGCPPDCPQGGCPPDCPQGGCPPENPPIVAAEAEGPAQIGPAGVPGPPRGGGLVAGPPAPVPVPELAFTGANLDLLVRGMLALALLGAALVAAGRIGGREEA